MKRVRNVFLCLALLFASVAGMPVTPDEIEELLKDMSQPKIVHSLSDEDTPPEPLPGLFQ
jgi:hypothetical protein